MVLIDTSVWIRFLGNRSPFAAELDSLLAAEQAVNHEFLYGELFARLRPGKPCDALDR